MQIGHKIYYDKLTGKVLVDSGEREGTVINTTMEEDFQNYSELQGISQDSVGIIQLDYGYLSNNFKNYFYSIDITNPPIDETSIKWSVIDPSIIVPPPPKTEIEILQDKIDANVDYVNSVSNNLSGFMDYVFTNDTGLPQ